MKTIKRALGPAVALFTAMPPVWAAAQADRLARDMTAPAVAGRSAISGMRYGGPGFRGYEVLSRYEHPPVPPADIPNVGSVRNNASAKRSPPLPRTRPGKFATGAAKESVPEPQAEPRAAAAGRLGVAPPTTSPPGAPTMVPIAPLE
jgi:hypothetical protein